jgi:hypothetical protein
MLIDSLSKSFASSLLKTGTKTNMQITKLIETLCDGDNNYLRDKVYIHKINEWYQQDNIKNMTKTKQQLEKIVNEYATNTNKDLLKAELELLVLYAERDQIKKDHEKTLEILRK